jgi:hypothetical protein
MAKLPCFHLQPSKYSSQSRNSVTISRTKRDDIACGNCSSLWLKFQRHQRKIWRHSILRKMITHRKTRLPTVALCVLVLVMALQGIIMSQRRIGSVRAKSNDSFQNMIEQVTENLTTTTTSTTSLSDPMCIYAENRGWGNSIFAVLTFLGQAKRVRNRASRTGEFLSSVGLSYNIQQSLQLSKTNFVDLRTGAPCHPYSDNNNDNNDNPHCVDYEFPCIYVEDPSVDPSNISTLGSVYTNLFTNMHACPNDPLIYNAKTCPRRTRQKKGVHELTIARDAIRKNRPVLPEMFELNATYIRYILKESGSLVSLENLMDEDLCAMQFRFGDYWFRENGSERALRDKRLCKEYDKKSNETVKCFEQQAEILLREACPDPVVPVYLATDWEEFAHYICKHYQRNTVSNDENNSISKTGKAQKRHFKSRCPSLVQSVVAVSEGSDTIPDNKHIHDVDLASESGKQILHHMLADWLVLALCKTSPLRKRHFASKIAHNSKLTPNSTENKFQIVSYGSTFVETADLHWKVV